MQTIVALSHRAVIIRHWFEIDLDDASMEHGVRIELRELAASPHRGSASAAQIVTADRPLWRADLFVRLADAPGSFGVAHFHPEFTGPEPCARVWDPGLTASPWQWLGDQITVQAVTVSTPEDTPDQSELLILIQYVLIETQSTQGLEILVQ